MPTALPELIFDPQPSIVSRWIGKSQQMTDPPASIEPAHIPEPLPALPIMNGMMPDHAPTLPDELQTVTQSGWVV